MSQVNVISQQQLKFRQGKPKGRIVDPEAHADILALLGDASRAPDMLIEHLHKLQDTFGHISSRHLAALAAEMKLSQTEAYEVATFYHHFDVVKEGQTPPPALTVRVCDSLACEMHGARALIEALGATLGDAVRVQAVPCVGRCQHAPVAVVGQNPVDYAEPAKVRTAVEARETAAAVATYISYDEYQAQGGYQLYRDCLAGKRSRDELIGIMEHSGLRGLGGAGFPVGRKWRIVSGYDAPRYMAVNIDEGEPGTFKDRHYLELDPHRFLEGMLVAAWAVGIDKIWIYLRDEYAGCRKLLEAELARLRAGPPAHLPPIELRRGAGAYICGEESAMVESIEGKRGMPRLRPPFLAEVGLFGQPTLEHNMESVYWVREIVEKGADWFTAQGRHGRKGLRSFSVSGRVNKPGVHLAPAGITVRELIDEYCGGMQQGHEFYGYFPGGASGGILPASLGDVPLDFDTLNQYGCFIGSAAIVVFSQHDRARDLALNAMKFFENESCGQCTPCRCGTAKAVTLMEAPRWDVPLLNELSGAMMDASICGLGQAAPNPMQCVIKYFPQELEGEASGASA
jgi:NADH:ubiquinone oxidoreductase subunit F (NADH-binding)/NADH:ubiquinone oxidoreductase subunit E